MSVGEVNQKLDEINQYQEQANEGLPQQKKRFWDFLPGNQSQKDTNAYNAQMAKYNWEKEIEQWERQNAYNSPAEQMKRFAEAGLNPNMIYGKGSASAGNASSSPKRQQTQAKAGTGISEIGKFISQVGMIKAQIENLNEATKAQRLANLEKSQDLGILPPTRNDKGEVSNVLYVKRFNDAIKSAEDALTASEQKILASKKVNAQALENRILTVKADLAEAGINFNNDNPIVRAVITALAQQDITLKDITADLIKRFL